MREIRWKELKIPGLDLPKPEVIWGKVHAISRNPEGSWTRVHYGRQYTLWSTSQRNEDPITCIWEHVASTDSLLAVHAWLVEFGPFEGQEKTDVPDL